MSDEWKTMSYLLINTKQLMKIDLEHRSSHSLPCSVKCEVHIYYLSSSGHKLYLKPNSSFKKYSSSIHTGSKISFFKFK